MTAQTPGQPEREELEATFRRTFALHPNDFKEKYEHARDAVMAAADTYALAAQEPWPTAELAALLADWRKTADLLKSRHGVGDARERSVLGVIIEQVEAILPLGPPLTPALDEARAALQSASDTAELIFGDDAPPVSHVQLKCFAAAMGSDARKGLPAIDAQQAQPVEPDCLAPHCPPSAVGGCEYPECAPAPGAVPAAGLDALAARWEAEAAEASELPDGGFTRARRSQGLAFADCARALRGLVARTGNGGAQ